MKTPLSDAINAHKVHLSFHTPAHSGVLSTEDITELSYSGNLLTRAGAVGESERLVAEAYGADEAFFVTSGATAAVHAAMSVFAGETFLVLGQAHKSVFSGLRLFAGRALYLGTTEGIREALDTLSPRVIVITSPDYFGNALDIEEISRLCIAKNIALIIDAAHGAHFAFCSKLPNRATEYGDMVIHSLHKTLPVLTGGALLLTKKQYADRALFALSELHTTSPSYPVMLSIERAVATMREQGERLWGETLEEVAHFTRTLPAPYQAVKSDDPTRLVLRSPYSGEAVAAALEARGIYPEMSYGNKVVFIVHPFNAEKLVSLTWALGDIGKLEEAAGEPQVPKYASPVALVTKGKWEGIPLLEAEGRTLYREIGYYPPGVPLYLPGRVLSAEDIALITSAGNSVFGLDKGRVFVVSL